MRITAEQIITLIDDLSNDIMDSMGASRDTILDILSHNYPADNQSYGILKESLSLLEIEHNNILTLVTLKGLIEAKEEELYLESQKVQP